MRAWDASRIAAACGARLVAEPSRSPYGGPARASIDSRLARAGDLFFGLRGERSDGGSHALQALTAGAWGVLVAPEHAAEAARERAAGAVLEHPDPLTALQRLALAWRHELRAAGAKVVAITGSTGKTSTKDILAALLASQLRTAASAANLNTEIGLPLAILAAPGDSQVLVLELAMRGSGQIAELTAIAEPDVGVIVNVGPAHLELLGSLEAIAAAKAELIAGLAPSAVVVLPHHEPLLEPHLRRELRTITFGDGGDVSLLERRADGRTRIAHGGEQIELWPSFAQQHNLRNLLAAVAAARALGVTPEGRLQVRFSAMRGERLALPGGVILIDDCYNANPMSMRAAIDDLADTAPARRVALLGDMLELGSDAPRLHREIGEHAGARGIQLLVTAGPLAAEIAAGFPGESHQAADAAAAAELLGGLLLERDTVLVKGSRGVGLERAVAALRAAGGRGAGVHAGDGTSLAPAAGSGRR
ncbi:MAG: UDP-N-acetylmuramoyl-tripeptide--D-alanyl-D-alanine ligase [Solirubrobacterales bacterium]|nr:UDP-N-acetylmuramoyl-tripeptide--D-alanyl-D-alanine ligase [Solirubrobacterales bacterium]